MNWNKLTVGKYQTIVATQEGGHDDLVKMIEIVRICEDLTIEQVHELSLRKVSEYFNSYTFLSELPEKVSKSFKLNDIEYIVCLDISKIKASQFIDLKEFTKDANSLNGNLHNVLAVLALPKGKKYDGATVIDRANYFKENLSCEIALPIMVFFWTFFCDYTIAMADYSEQKKKEKK
jgi:hypothetical protein